MEPFWMSEQGQACVKCLICCLPQLYLWNIIRGVRWGLHGQAVAHPEQLWAGDQAEASEVHAQTSDLFSL